MIRHQLARILSALADRLEVEKQQPEIQYVYIYSAPPSTVTAWTRPLLPPTTTCAN